MNKNDVKWPKNEVYQLTMTYNDKIWPKMTLNDSKQLKMTKNDLNDRNE